jgi:protein-tyrosine-phosphatase/predicted ATP-grasp superfamily ATP-dependent carboligase
MSHGNSNKVLVLGDDTRSFLTVVRSLGRAGLQVHIAWYGSDNVARRSRYVAQTHLLPGYDDSCDDWKTALIQLLQQESFDLVIPCSDPVLLPLQKHRKELECFGRLYLLDDQVQEIVGDKLKTTEFARSVGVCVPREQVITQLSEAADLPVNFQLPVVLKPQSSFDPHKVGTRRKVRKAYSWEDCLSQLDEMLASGPVAVQENFVGVGVGVELLLAAGEPLMTFQHVREHEPLHGGGSSYRKSVAVAPHLLDAALKILRPLTYTGVAMVEFKVNPGSGEWVFIEINGRFWGSLPLALAAGADFPLGLYQLLVQGRTCFPNRYRHGIYCRNLVGDLHWQLANIRADRSDPTLATRPLTAVLRETVMNLVLFRERSDTFVLDDPVPGITEILSVLGQITNSLYRRMQKKYLQSPIIRKKLNRAAIHAFRNSQNIIFICKGNICRSPFAEQLVRSNVPRGKNVLSAGYIPKAGRSSPEPAIGAARKWTVDLSGHRSRVLNQDSMAADAIFVFDYDNYVRVLTDFPVAAQRIHFVGALRLDGELFIEDPWGEDVNRFNVIYQQIADALQPHIDAVHLRHG